MRYFIELSYNGSQYHGWQNQPNAITVQEVLEGALSTLLKESISIVGAGRTDTGVHAMQMFAHFDYNNTLDPENLVFKLNSFLPKDIAIQDIFEVKEDAHARFDAVSRTYVYRVNTRKDVFQNDLSYWFKQEIDVAIMNEASKILFDYKNFKCFSRSNTDVKTYNCSIMEAQWQEKEGEIVFTITADRFLRNMVRAIVGTMLDIGIHKMTLESLHDIIKSEDRSQAGASAPGHALFLKEIKYPNSILN